MDCLFCKIINGEIPSKKIYEDDLVIGVLDAFPLTDGHTLIIPKKHYEDYTKIDQELLIHVNEVSIKLTNLLKEKLNINSVSFLVNYLDAQKIKHYHYHIIPNHGSKPKKTTEEIYDLIMK